MKIPDKLYIYYIKGKVKKEVYLEDFIGCWIEGGDSFLFFSKKHDEVVEKILSDPRLELKDTFEVDYFDWIGGKIDIFAVGDIRFIPIWDKVDRLRDKDIILDPSVVFGSGTHKTTLNSLWALDYIYAKDNNIKSVLDLGCGTGILSLYCARKGTEKIYAVDLNPLAVKTTKKNAKINKLEQSILPIWGRAQDFSNIHTDVLVANIHFDVICNILSVFNLKKYNWLVLSGIFSHQLTEIENLLKIKGIKVHEIIGEENGWPTILGGKNSYE